MPFPLAQAGSKWSVLIGLPNRLLGEGPSSPFNAGLNGSPCTTKSWLTSVHVRDRLLLADAIGFSDVVFSLPSCSTKRFTLALTAVLPLPKASQATPRRGSQSFQFSTSAAGNTRATGR